MNQKNSFSIIVIAVFVSLLYVCLSCNTSRKAVDRKAPNLASIIAPGANIKKITDQFEFTEGPAVDRHGDVYFTDQPNDKIWKYSSNGELSLFLDKTGRSNGLFFDPEGNLIACADENNELRSINAKGKATVLLSSFKGKRFNGPNDLWIDKNGGIYFTDPYYQRDYWQRTKPEMSSQNVYYLAKGSTEAIVVADKLERPNGIVGSADGKYLYVADIRANKTFKYQITENGSLVDRQLYVNQGSDGMTLDNLGNLYLTGKTGVSIYDKTGIKLGNITIPAPRVSNVCFVGKRRTILFITACAAIYTLEMRVKGIE